MMTALESLCNTRSETGTEIGVLVLAVAGHLAIEFLCNTNSEVATEIMVLALSLPETW